MNSSNNQQIHEKLNQLKVLSLVSQVGKVNELEEEDAGTLFALFHELTNDVHKLISSK